MKYRATRSAKPRGGLWLKSARSASSRSGSVLFEFAVTVPLMMILAVAVLDLSKITFLHFLVSDAAGASSRYASMVPVQSESMDMWQQSLEDAARGSLVGSPWIDPSELIIPLAGMVQISDQERSITIRVEYPYEAQFPWMGFSTQSTIAHEVTVYGAN